MKEKIFKIKDKIKNIIIIILVLSIAIGYPVMYNLGKIKTTKLLDKARSALSKTSDLLDEARVELVNKLSLIATKEEIIKDYQAKETINTIIVGTRDINVELFKEVEVKITLDKEYPWAIFDDKYQLDSDIFGNFVEIKDEIDVMYYYGAVANKIDIQNVDNEKVEITYKSSAFMNPYRIVSRDTSLNLGAYVMTNTKDDEIYKLINTVGINQLSDIEDAFIEKLRKEYQDTTVPIYVNGVLLKDWNLETDKIFEAESIDGMCTVKIIE